jgi:hypothetical protein
MNPWRWVRARRWWIQVLGAAVVVPVGLVLLYVAGRSLQYVSAEKDAGLYVPSTANVIVRARELEGHVARIRDSVAWRVLQRKILKDPVLRREINTLLKSNDAPSLEDLEDERKPFARNLPRVLDAVGSDLIASLQVKASLATAPFCGIVRLRWLHFLAAPLARLLLPTDTIGGETCLVLRQNRQEVRVAVVGALAILSNDRALLEQALQRKGREEETGRPIEARIVFEGSQGLLQIRQKIRDSGLFPYVKWETARGLSVSGDLREATLAIDATIDRAEAVHPCAPPLALRAWAPESTSGLMITNTGGADLIEWLRGLITPGSRDSLSENVREALQDLDDGGLSLKFLPLLREGMEALTGVEEQGGQSVPTLTLILPSKNPQAAIEALNALVRKIAGAWGDSKYFTSESAGETTVYSWSWPRGVKIADLANPTYAALKDTVVIGSNKAFTLGVIRTAAQEDGFDHTSSYRKLRSRLKELGFSADPSLSGGLLYPPLIRESLQESLIHVAKLTTSINGAVLRAEVEAELRRQGRPLTDAEIVPAYNEALNRKVRDQEAALRGMLEPMNAARWAAFEALSIPKGVAFHFALEFR